MLPDQSMLKPTHHKHHVQLTIHPRFQPPKRLRYGAEPAEREQSRQATLDVATDKSCACQRPNRTDGMVVECETRDQTRLRPKRDAETTLPDKLPNRQIRRIWNKLLGVERLADLLAQLDSLCMWLAKTPPLY